MLNLSKKSHCEKFLEELEEQIERHQLESMITKYQRPTHQQIEHIDKLITIILNAATKKVEGQRRNIPYSKEKAKRSAIVKYWKMYLRRLKGERIDKDKMIKIQEKWQINIEDTLEYQQAKERLVEAKS